MENYDTINKIEEYFKQINCYGTYNYCFITTTMPSSVFMGMFGAIGALISIKKNKKVMGYLLNKNDFGIVLIPLVVDTINKNKLDLENHIIIKNEDIEKLTIRSEEVGFKRIRITLKDNTKYILKAANKIKNIDYQKTNLDKFIEIYK